MSLKKQQRQSNIEAARILAMSLIMIWHFCVHGTGDNKDFLIFRYLLPFINYGVDLFILISGFFLIRLKPKGIINLAVVIVAFELFSLICTCIVTENVPVASMAKHIIDPLGNSQYWFITYYVALVLLSPILNKSLETTDKIVLRKIIIILAAFNTISCWLFSSRLDQGGYSLFNFILLYCIGHYIRVENLSAKMTKFRILSTFIVATSVNLLIIGCLILKNHSIDFESLAFSLAGKYSNPFTIVCASSVLMLFLKFKFNSTTINSFASCSLGVYLLQDGEIGQLLYRFQAKIANEGNMMNYLLLCTIFFLGFWFSSFILMRSIRKLIYISTKYFENMAHKLHTIRNN